PAALPALPVSLRAREGGRTVRPHLLREHVVLRHAPPLARRAAAAPASADRRRSAQPRGSARQRLRGTLHGAGDEGVVRRRPAASGHRRPVPAVAGAPRRAPRRRAGGDRAGAGGRAAARPRARRLLAVATLA